MTASRRVRLLIGDGPPRFARAAPFADRTLATIVMAQPGEGYAETRSRKNLSKFAAPREFPR